MRFYTCPLSLLHCLTISASLTCCVACHFCVFCHLLLSPPPVPHPPTPHPPLSLSLSFALSRHFCLSHLVCHVACHFYVFCH